MSLTVGKVLQNAEHKITNGQMALQVQIGKDQLTNYIIAKELGAEDDDDWCDWEEKVQKHKETN